MHHLNSSASKLSLSLFTLAGLALLAAPSSAQASDIEVVLVNAPGHPKSLLPGTGQTLLPGFFSDVIYDVTYSRDGTHRAIGAALGDLSNITRVLVVDDSLVLTSGDPSPWMPQGEMRLHTNNAGNMRLSNDGDFVLESITMGAVTTNSEKQIVHFNPQGVPTVVAHGRLPVDPLLPGLGASYSWAEELGEPMVTETGQVGYHGVAVEFDNPSSGPDAVLVLGSTVLSRLGDVPAGQLVLPEQPIDNFFLSNIRAAVSGDGRDWVARLPLEGSSNSDIVVLHNGTVALQEGAGIPGTSLFSEPIASSNFFASSGITYLDMDPGGSWWARGFNEGSEQDWVIRDGEVLAYSGGTNEIFPGAGEHWVDDFFAPCFFVSTGNGSGSYILGGTTDNPDPAKTVVVTLTTSEGTSVLYRSGDPVDLDGNGLFDDDRFISSAFTDEAYLMPDNSVEFIAALRTGDFVGTDVGLLRISSVEHQPFCFGDGGDLAGCTACPCANDAAPGTSGGCINASGQSAVLTASGIAQAINDTLSFQVSDANPSTFALLMSADNQLPRMGNCPPGSGALKSFLDGLSCVGGSALRHGSRRIDTFGEVGSTTTGWGGPNDPAGGLITSSGFSAGQTRHFQVVYRESLQVGCGTGLNTTNAVSVTVR